MHSCTCILYTVYNRLLLPETFEDFQNGLLTGIDSIIHSWPMVEYVFKVTTKQGKLNLFFMYCAIIKEGSLSWNFVKPKLNQSVCTRFVISIHKYRPYMMAMNFINGTSSISIILLHKMIHSLFFYNFYTAGTGTPQSYVEWFSFLPFFSLSSFHHFEVILFSGFMYFFFHLWNKTLTRCTNLMT